MSSSPPSRSNHDFLPSPLNLDQLWSSNDRNNKAHKVAIARPASNRTRHNSQESPSRFRDRLGREHAGLTFNHPKPDDQGSRLEVRIDGQTTNANTSRMSSTSIPATLSSSSTTQTPRLRAGRRGDYEGHRFWSRPTSQLILLRVSLWRTKYTGRKGM
jgi:hypothetical protein